MDNIYNAIQNLYNMDKTTWQEVLAELYNLVSNIDNKFDLFELKFGSLLGEQVIKELKKMYDDGSLASLINDKLLKDINTKVDTTETVVTELNEQLTNLVITKAEKNTTDNLQSQINDLVLNSGGDSNLEVVQSRTNAFGSIFQTSKNHLDNIEKAIFNKIDRKYRYKWVIGTTHHETGGTATNLSRITTDGIIYADKDLTISMSNYTKYKFGYRTYPNYPQLNGSIDTGWKFEDVVIPQGTYFRINVSKFDDSVHNMSDAMTGELFDAISIIDNKTIEYCLSYDLKQIYTDVKNNKKEIENIKKNENGVVINEKDSNVLGIAHRGLSLECPENTMIGYKEAYNKGFRILETDVKITSDNVLVLLHDTTINRVARNKDGSEITETLNISNMTYEQASQYDYGLYKDVKFKGTKLATLEELLLYAKKYNCKVYIDGFASNIINKIYLLVNKLGMLRNVIWSSFVKSDLQQILNLDKKAHVVYLYSGSTIENSTIDDVSTLKTDFNEVSFATYYPNVTDLGLIEYAHYKGIRFGIYTVNINSEIIRFVNAGVDEITTDGLNVAQVMLDDV